jgi:hypothetical protein
MDPDCQFHSIMIHVLVLLKGNLLENMGRSVLLVEEPRVRGENHRPVASHLQN